MAKIRYNGPETVLEELYSMEIGTLAELVTALDAF